MGKKTEETLAETAAGLKTELDDLIDGLREVDLRKGIAELAEIIQTLPEGVFMVADPLAGFVVHIVPPLWVLFSSRARGRRKLLWAVIVALTSWPGLMVFYVGTWLWPGKKHRHGTDDAEDRVEEPVTGSTA